MSYNSGVLSGTPELNVCAQNNLDESNILKNDVEVDDYVKSLARTPSVFYEDIKSILCKICDKNVDNCTCLESEDFVPIPKPRLRRSSFDQERMISMVDSENVVLNPLYNIEEDSPWGGIIRRMLKDYNDDLRDDGVIVVFELPPSLHIKVITLAHLLEVEKRLQDVNKLFVFKVCRNGTKTLIRLRNLDPIDFLADEYWNIVCDTCGIGGMLGEVLKVAAPTLLEQFIEHMSQILDFGTGGITFIIGSYKLAFNGNVLYSVLESHIKSFKKDVQVKINGKPVPPIGAVQNGDVITMHPLGQGGSKDKSVKSLIKKMKKLLKKKNKNTKKSPLKKKMSKNDGSMLSKLMEGRGKAPLYITKLGGKNSSLSDWMKCIMDPFADSCQGTRIPDNLGYPTSVFQKKSFFTLVSVTGAASTCVKVSPNPYISLVDAQYHNFGSSTACVTSPNGYATYTANPWVYAMAATGLSNYATARIVYGGVRVRNKQPPSTAVGAIQIWPIIEMQKWFGYYVLLTQSIPTGSIAGTYAASQQMYGGATVQQFTSSNSNNLPNARELNVLDLMGRDLVLPFRPITEDVKRFKSCITGGSLSSTVNMSVDSLYIPTTGLTIAAPDDNPDNGNFDVGWMSWGIKFVEIPSASSITVASIDHIVGFEGVYQSGNVSTADNVYIAPQAATTNAKWDWGAISNGLSKIPYERVVEAGIDYLNRQRIVPSRLANF